MRITVPKSGFAQAALILLLVNAFGALAVGLPLLAARLPTEHLWLPVAASAWGIASLVGAYGVWRVKRWALWIVAPTQGAVAAALLWAWATIARDWSVLLVAALAGGAALLTMIHRLGRR
jgi:hypothetical protein